MTELSPAAQAVLDAFRTSHTGAGCLAAALRAAADHLGEELEFYNARMIDAEDLLAIAAELEAQ